MNEKRTKIKFSVTGRRITPADDMLKKLASGFPGVEISDVFAFVPDFTPLYGGRIFIGRNYLSYKQLEIIYKQGWTFSLPISNMFFSEKAYQQTIPILEKVYRPGNNVIVSTVELAKRIRKDFPDFKIKASCIANIGFNTKKALEEIEQSFEYYDIITLHQKLWNNEEILSQIKEKERICIFADTSCAPFCSNQACYHNTSMRNFYQNTRTLEMSKDFDKKECFYEKNIRKKGYVWDTINFQEPLHPMYEGIIHFKYGMRRSRSNKKLYDLLKKQGHPGY